MHLISKFILILTFTYVAKASITVVFAALLGLLIAHLIHYLGIWLIALIALLFYYEPHLLAFALGGLLHCGTEALTRDGIRFLPYGKFKIHILNGVCKKGSLTEYVIIGLIVLAALLFPNHTVKDEFAPYMYNWEQLYEDGVIDAYEWKQHRFHYF